MTTQDKPDIAVGELAATLHLAPSTLTRFLDRLESRGLVERFREGRSVLVRVTAAGAKLRPELDEGWKKLYRRYAAILGGTESRTLTTQIDAACDILENAEQAE